MTTTPAEQNAASNSYRLTLILHNEVNILITAMRQNSRWAFIQPYGQQGEELEGDKILQDLLILRQKLFEWEDIREVDPLTYLEPFLSVIQDVGVNGIITSVALLSLQRLLQKGVVGQSKTGVARALRAVVQAVHGCKFEVADEASDGMVLCRILQTFMACVGCDSRQYLTNQDLYKIFCQVLKFADETMYADTKAHNEMVINFARQMAVEMVGNLFKEVGKMEAMDQDAIEQFNQSQKISKRSNIEPVQVVEVAHYKECKEISQQKVEQQHQQQQQQQQVADSVQSISMDSAGQEDDSQLSAGEQDVGEGEPNDKSIIVVQTTPNQRVVFSEELHQLEDEELNMSPFNIETLTYMFATIMDLLGNKDPIMSMLGLELTHEAIEAAGKDLLSHASLMSIIKKRLFLNLVTLLRQHVLSPREPSVALLMRVNQIIFTVYSYLGSHVMLQIESFLHNVLLKVIDGRLNRMVVTDAMVEVALEGVVSLCSQPEFIHHCYANLDCKIDHTNIFEDICNTLSKRAFPVSNYQLLTPVHQLALTGLVQILQNLGKYMEPDDSTQLRKAWEEHSEYFDFWTPIIAGGLVRFATGQEHAAWKFNIRREKYYKVRLEQASEIFNAGYKKSIEHLDTSKLISSEPLKRIFDYSAFLRLCPTLSKTEVGTVLGERKDFLIDVLKVYAEKFNFKNLDIHVALRLFLESFRLPGEGQKIDRIVGAFANSYRQQHPGGPCKTEDAVHVVAYALIMLNSNLFNPNVRPKDRMTFKSFRRQLEGQNDGADFPEEWLMELFNAIAEHEIKLVGEGDDIDVSGAQWESLFVQGNTDRGKMVYEGRLGAFTWDMFEQCWSPMVHAITTVLEKCPQDQSWDIAIIDHCLKGIKLAAQIGANFNEEKVLDNLVTSLSQFAQILNPQNGTKSIVIFRRSYKARECFKVMLKDLIHKYGDGLSQSWRNVVDCVIRLYKLDLLPPSTFSIEQESDADGETIPTGLKRSGSSTSTSANQSSSFLRGLFLFGDESSSISQEVEKEAIETCKKLVEECRMGDILLDSKFLRKESLIHLIQAIIKAAGLVKSNETENNSDSKQHSRQQQQQQHFDVEVQEVCLELLISITIRNRDRITVIWPLVSQHLETIMLLPYGDDNMLEFIERSVLGLLRICQRLLPYKEEVTDQLMRTLQKVVSLDSERALDLVPGIARGVLVLVRTTAASINTPSAWVTICSLLRMTFVHQQARPMVVQALQIIVNQNEEGGSLLRPVNFSQCADTCRDMIRLSRGEMDGEWSKIALDMIEQMCNWLITQVERLVDAGQNGDGQSMGMVGLFWQKLVEVLVEAGLETLPLIREHAMVSLHRILIQSDQLGLSAPLILQIFKEQLIPMANELADKVARPYRDFPSADSTLRLLVHAISKTYLQYLDLLKSEPEFIQLWQALLTTLVTSVRNRSEILKETVPEQVKNLLLVMYSRGVLVPEWKDQQGHSMWEATWKKVQQISPGLTTEIINISPEPQSQQSQQQS
eukprot:TRINITY_DN5085_c0_g1_i1.p1 TRINITY_DN5085_c0_g1~~TRINITY_DN5085_c0_g1_i1.p1  ORF type:complete len:1501 (+),score=206.20 TRINITY_DN5085_c0_g1_i1:351-4853(+)